MFHHLTLIRLRNDASAGADAAAVLAAREMPDAIPSIVSMSCGVALPNGERWDQAFAFSFEDAAGFEAFAAHQSSAEAPTLQELLARIDETRPILERNVDKTEADRRVAQENIDALTEAGAFRVMTPRRFGGYQMTIREKL